MTYKITVRKREILGYSSNMRNVTIEPWTNFINEITGSQIHVYDLEGLVCRRLKKYNAVFHVNQGILEFEDEQSASHWLLRYS